MNWPVLKSGLWPSGHLRRMVLVSGNSIVAVSMGISRISLGIKFLTCAEKLLNFWNASKFCHAKAQIDFERCDVSFVEVNMTLKRQRQRSLLQLTAIFCLLVWITSIAVCAANCTGGQKQHDCCHKKSSDKPLCLHSQTIASAPASEQTGKPDFGIQPYLISQVLNLSSQLEPKPDSCRQPTSRDFVFTPDVCLCPAFRSLAPPVSA